MNRKNLTAAVLAGLAGAAGIAGTAQAVNMNPDGLGQVLIYPYYTSNGGNQTLISVVNTTDQAKAVKVRFLEGYNSREVLDFNLYLSREDVWVAAVAPYGATTGMETAPPHLFIPDTSCTVPYLYEDKQMDIGGTKMGVQPLLNIAYAGTYNDGGPEDIARAAEGHLEIIEMGTLTGPSAVAATHVATADGRVPADCDSLVESWTIATAGNGQWFSEAAGPDGCDLDDDSSLEDYDKGVRGACAQAYTDTERNSGGLFGAAAVVNAVNGTMFSYDAKAIQGFDKTDDGIHYRPGLIYPSLDSGNQYNAFVFFGAPQNEAAEFSYNRGVEAVSATFMHEHIMNEYTIDEGLAASTEWVVTFPTKSFYVDDRVLEELVTSTTFWQPNPSDAIGCNGWTPGDPNPVLVNDQGWTVNANGDPNDWANTNNAYDDFTSQNFALGWVNCDFVQVTEYSEVKAIRPFTEIFDGESCDRVSLKTWDREEDTFEPDTPGGTIPPDVSPSVPDDCDPSNAICDSTPFELCYEVNVLRMGDGVIFDTPTIEGSSLLLEVDPVFDAGWGRIDLHNDVSNHVDSAGLVGLPATGFAATVYENNFAEGATVKAYYGGLFGHKGNVRRTLPPECDKNPCGSFPVRGL